MEAKKKKHKPFKEELDEWVIEQVGIGRKKIEDLRIMVIVFLMLISIFLLIFSISCLISPKIIATFSVFGLSKLVVLKIFKISLLGILLALILIMIKKILKVIGFYLKVCFTKIFKLKNSNADPKGKLEFGKFEENSKKGVVNRPGLPPFDLLKHHEKVSGTEDIKKELLSFFKHYDLDYVKIKHVYAGPRITTFILDTGQKQYKEVQKYQNEIASYFGMDDAIIRNTKRGLELQIENEKTEMVGAKELFTEFESNRPSGFPEEVVVPIGRMADGDLLLCNISDAPHFLVAGATGSGKSVTENVLITGILTLYKPEEVQLYLMDPKRVELTFYNGAPHVVGKVVTDIEYMGALFEHIFELSETRYKIFAEEKVRDLKSYNKKNQKAPLPHIVVFVDELADIMLFAGEKVETYVQALGQKARAAGVHMVLATQRPSKEVVTGVIKSNIPSRIAFACASRVDSQIILDVMGAEKLLGEGDGLIQTRKMRKPERFQGAFISDKEIESVVDWWKKGGKQTQKARTQVVLEKEETIEEEVNLNEQDLKAYYYLYEKSIETEEDRLKLPSLSLMRTQIGIKKEKLVEILKEMEEKGMIERSGAGPNTKTELLLEKRETYEFLKAKIG